MWKSRLPWTPVLGAAAVGLLGYACTTPLVPEDVRLRPSNMSATSPSTRTATVGTVITNYPAVLVRDQFGDPLPEVSVTFGASSGSGPTPPSVQTNASGQASPTSWTLPTTSGTVTATASIPGSAVGNQTFTVTLNPGPASAMVVNPATNSNAQTGTAGQALPIAPSALVRDQYGNPVSGVNVTFAVTGGGGTVVPTTAIPTNAQGIATVTSWTLGTTVGTNTLRATAVGVTAPLDFTATGAAGAPASIAVGGDGSSQGQTAIANTTVTNAPIVLVRDANNNPVSGVTVRFTVTGGSGKILTSSTDNTGQNTQDVTTGSNGQASIFAWRLGSTGANTLSAALPSFTSVTAFIFTANGIIGPPTQIAQNNASWANTQSGTVHGGTPGVVVRDAGNNPVPNLTVSWSSPDANSTVTGTTVTSTTGTQGIALFPRGTAAWTAAGAVGTTMTLVASVQSTSLTRSFTSKIVGAATQIAVHEGNNQTGSINTAVAIRPAVRLTDANGDFVPGASASFAVTLGGGSVTGTPALADSVGVARVTSWTLGGTVGTNNNALRATLTSSTQFVDFIASATSGPPATIVAKSTNPTSGSVNSTQTVTVIVRDASSNLVQGASVTFTPTNTPGNAAITSTNPAITNASGEATVQWRLDTLARTNTVSAVTAGSSGNISTQLSITGTALAPSKLTITAGNNQTHTPGATLPINPTVRVTDQYNNAIASQGVNWTVTTGSVNCGSGASTSCQSTSGSTGLASVTWTLGSSTSVQTLQAALAASPTVTVTFTTVTACNPTSYSLGSTVSGSIATTDCATGSPAVYSDFYRFTIASTTTLRVSAQPTSGWTGVLTGWYWLNNASGIFFQGASSNAIVDTYAILAAGTYDFEVKPTTAGTTGTYQVTSATNPSIPSSNCSFMVTKGVSHAFNLDATATGCLYRSTQNQTITDRSSRRYLIVLDNQQAMTLTMTGSTLDNYMEVYNLATNALVATINSGGLGATESGTFNNTTGSSQFYVVRVTHALTSSSDTPKSGSYTFQIQ